MSQDIISLDEVNKYLDTLRPNITDNPAERSKIITKHNNVMKTVCNAIRNHIDTEELLESLKEEISSVKDINEAIKIIDSHLAEEKMNQTIHFIMEQEKERHAGIYKYMVEYAKEHNDQNIQIGTDGKPYRLSTDTETYPRILGYDSNGIAYYANINNKI